MQDYYYNPAYSVCQYIVNENLHFLTDARRLQIRVDTKKYGFYRIFCGFTLYFDTRYGILRL